MRRNMSQVRVIEAIGDSPAAIRELWRYLLAIDWMDRSRLHAPPPDHPLFLLVRRPNQLGWKVFDGLWLRLLDVGAALSARSLAADGRITFELNADPMFPENAGTWTLEAGCARRSSRRADVRLDVQALASAYLAALRSPTSRARAASRRQPARHRSRRRALPRRRKALVPEIFVALLRDVVHTAVLSQSQLRTLAEHGEE